MVLEGEKDVNPVTWAQTHVRCSTESVESSVRWTSGAPALPLEAGVFDVGPAMLSPFPPGHREGQRWYAHRELMERK